MMRASTRRNDEKEDEDEKDEKGKKKREDKKGKQDKKDQLCKKNNIKTFSCKTFQLSKMGLNKYYKLMILSISI